MTLKAYLWGLRISTFFSFIAWILVVLNIDPGGTGLVGLSLFYFSLALFLTGIFSLFFFWARRKASEEEDLPAKLGMSFRQGVLISIMVVILLVMQNKKVLVWWDGLIVVAGIFLIELNFLFKQKA